MILTTLGTLLTKMGGRDRLQRAEHALRRSVALKEALGDEDDGFTLSALGALLARRGGRDRLLEAEQLLRQSRLALPSEARRSATDRLAQVLLRLGDQARLNEAEAILREALELSDEDLDRAVTMNTLAAVLLQRGDNASLEEAEELATSSAELGRITRNDRHVAMALLTSSWVAERRGDLAVAIERAEEVVRINERLQLSREAIRAEERLQALRERVERGQ